MAKTDPQRRVDLAAALASAKPGERWDTQECAAIWGVSKPRFVNKYVEFPDFPDPEKDGNRHLYDKVGVIKSMLAYLDRHQAASLERAKRHAALLGGDEMEEALKRYTPQEIIHLNRLQTEMDQRAIAQGLYVPVTEVSAVAGAVFSEISEFMTGLSNKIDPHGKLDPNLRKLIDTNAHSRLLQVHNRLKALLADAVDGTPAAKARSARKPRLRRQG